MKVIMSVLALSLVALAAVPFIIDIEDDAVAVESSVVVKPGNAAVSVKIGDTLHINSNGTLGTKLGNVCVSTTGKVETCI